MANIIKEKELKASWDSLTASDPTKAIGHKQTLEPEIQSNVSIEKKRGIQNY